MKRLVIILSLGLCFTRVCAQHELVKRIEKPDSTTSAAVPKAVISVDLKESDLSMRNSFESADDKADPATASFTLTSGKPNSYLIDVGVLYSFSHYKWDPATAKKSSLSLGPFAVIDKNTMIDKEQATYRGGMDIDYMWGKKDNSGNIENYINSTIQYQRNQQDTSNSLILTSYFSFKNNNKSGDKFFINNYNEIGGSSIFYFFKFNAGLEFQDIFQAGTSPTGLQARLLGEGAFSLAWRRHGTGQKTKVKELWPKMFELTFDYTSRWAWANTVAGSDRYIPLFKPSLNYYPLFNDKFSVGLSYNDGSDPIAGLPKQKYWQLAVQFQK